MYDSFLTSDYRAEQVFLQQVREDAGNTTLSRTFQIYYRLRPLIPIALRQYLQKLRGHTVDDEWYVPADFICSLARSVAGKPAEIPIIHPWPDGERFCFVLTHDVETSDGLRHVLRVAQIEEELGFRSSWNFVPYKYDVDPGLIADLKSRSFEIGIHGYNHDGRLYASKRVFDRRVAAINEALDKYGAVGFRSPMVHRNLQWLQALNIEYDASCFDVDPFQAAPGGVGSIWPFVAGKFIELPYTLPQDHTLFMMLRQRDCRIWERKLDFIVRNHGMALMLTHPGYLACGRNLELYRDFLERVRDGGGYWHALPKDVAAWWKQRAKSELVTDGGGQWRVRGPTARGGVPALLDVDGADVTMRPFSSSRVANQAES